MHACREEQQKRPQPRCERELAARDHAARAAVHPRLRLPPGNRQEVRQWTTVYSVLLLLLPPAHALGCRRLASGREGDSRAFDQTSLAASVQLQRHCLPELGCMYADIALCSRVAITKCVRVCLHGRLWRVSVRARVQDDETSEAMTVSLIVSSMCA